MVGEKMVTRTFKTTTVTALRVAMENGELKQEEKSVSFTGNTTVKDSKILKMFEEQHGKGQYLIKGKEENEKTYGMDEQKFMEQATIIERSPSQRTGTQKDEVKEEVTPKKPVKSK